MPFAYVEAAANVLTNPQLDPYGKIPEFKYSAARAGQQGERDRRRVSCGGRSRAPAHFVAVKFTP